MNIVKPSLIQILCYLELKPCDLEVLRCQAVKDQTAAITKKESAADAALKKVKDASASHDEAGGVIPPVTNCLTNCSESRDISSKLIEPNTTDADKANSLPFTSAEPPLKKLAIGSGKKHAKAFEDYNKLKDDLAALKENITRKDAPFANFSHHHTNELGHPADAVFFAISSTVQYVQLHHCLRTLCSRCLVKVQRSLKSSRPLAGDVPLPR